MDPPTHMGGGQGGSVSPREGLKVPKRSKMASIKPKGPELAYMGQKSQNIQGNCTSTVVCLYMVHFVGPMGILALSLEVSYQPEFGGWQVQTPVGAFLADEKSKNG